VGRGKDDHFSGKRVFRSPVKKRVLSVTFLGVSKKGKEWTGKRLSAKGSTSNKGAQEKIKNKTVEGKRDD